MIIINQEAGIDDGEMPTPEIPSEEEEDLDDDIESSDEEE